MTDTQPQLTYPSFSLAGKKAIVTGASRGIGRALAMGLAHAGAKVALTGRNECTLQKVADEILAMGKTATVQRLDVTGCEDIQKAVESCANRMQGLDILVNNAGYEQVTESLNMTPEIWDAILTTNLKGAFFCARAAAEIMVSAGGGAILNVCSLSSAVGIPTAVPYTSSKTGLLGMTRALAAEWAPRKIRVNAIAPGYFRTAMTNAFFEDQAWADAMLAKIPAGRFGHVRDLMGAAVFLLSPAAEYITGQMLAVDGGYLASI